VLEEEMQTTFVRFVNESRVRYATSIIETMPKQSITLDNLAEQSGFESVEEFTVAFTQTCSLTPEDYVQQFGQ
jgi:transcriptional regulator GlxA family with amidase domain